MGIFCPIMSLLLMLSISARADESGEIKSLRQTSLSQVCNDILNVSSAQKQSLFERARERRIRQNNRRHLTRPELPTAWPESLDLKTLVANGLKHAWVDAQNTLQVREPEVHFLNATVWPRTIEVVRQFNDHSQDGHVFIRIGDKFVSYWPIRGLAIDNLDYLLKNKPKGYRLQGFVLRLTPEELSRLYDFLESSDRPNRSFSMLFNNCSTFVCEALRAIQIPVPIWPMSSLPSSLASRMDASQRLIFKTEYFN